MHFLAAVLPLLALVSASHNPPHLRHRRLAHSIQQREPEAHLARLPRGNEAHAEAHRAVKRAVVKKGLTCRPRSQPQAAVSASPSPSSASPSPVPSSSAAPAPSSSTIENQNAIAPHPTGPASSAAPAPTQQPPANNGGGGGGGNSNGLLQVNDGRCGWCNSNPDAPNGAEDWLNCGINNGGWNPPHISLNQLVAKDLNPHGVFAPCSQYFDMFRQYGNEFGIPPIMLASFAMQESTCQQWVTGGGGEAGLMQIAPPNCEQGHDCWEVNYNIRRAAQLFSNMINANGGNVLAAIGSYNGWRVGMTYDDATRARHQGNCLWQNNLDYLTQFLNGWMQDRSGYNLGSYFNLRGC